MIRVACSSGVSFTQVLKAEEGEALGVAIVLSELTVSFGCSEFSRSEDSRALSALRFSPDVCASSSMAGGDEARFTRRRTSACWISPQGMWFPPARRELWPRPRLGGGLRSGLCRCIVVGGGPLAVIAFGSFALGTGTRLSHSGIEPSSGMAGGLLSSFAFAMVSSIAVQGGFASFDAPKDFRASCFGSGGRGDLIDRREKQSSKSVPTWDTLH